MIFAIPVIFLVAWLDYTTPPEIRFYLLYLGPLFAIAWWGAERDAIVMAVASAILSTATDTPWRPTLPLAVLLWNAISRSVLLIAAAALFSQLRESREKLAVLDRDHKRLYGKEAMNARTDALTQLPNLRSFLESIQRELARAVREGSKLCVLYIDLDDFKTVNDRYGHQTGDLVLQQVAQALQSSTRGGDLIARIGGDEFIILLWHALPADATIVAERMSSRIREIAIAYPLASLDASIGLRYFEQPPTSADDVVRLADGAMYEQKERRKKKLLGEAVPVESGRT